MIRRNSDQIALIAQGDTHRFYERVVIPALQELTPQLTPSGRSLDEGETSFLELARINTHNALCYEARNSFALSLGAAYERQIRLWLSHTAKDRRKEIEKISWPHLEPLILELKNIDIKSLPISNDINELRLIVNCVRHGDGGSVSALERLNPQLWHHLSSGLRSEYAKHGLLTHSMRIADKDLARYVAAILTFWEHAGGSAPPLGRLNASQLRSN